MWLGWCRPFASDGRDLVFPRKCSRSAPPLANMNVGSRTRQAPWQRERTIRFVRPYACEDPSAERNARTARMSADFTARPRERFHVMELVSCNDEDPSDSRVVRHESRQPVRRSPRSLPGARAIENRRNSRMISLSVTAGSVRGIRGPRAQPRRDRASGCRACRRSDASFCPTGSSQAVPRLVR